MGTFSLFPSASDHLKSAQGVLWQLLRLGLKSEILICSSLVCTRLLKLPKPYSRLILMSEVNTIIFIQEVYILFGRLF